MLALLLLTFGIITRFITHSPNFTPIIAIALFAGVYADKRYAIIIPLALMVVTDIFLGFHEAIAFTWGSVLLITVMGLNLRNQKSAKNIAIKSLFSAILFFVMTNFGVWLMSGWYEKSMAGLTECFVLAIPFFRNTLLSTAVYGVALFGIYELIARRVSNTKLAFVLSK